MCNQKVCVIVLLTLAVALAEQKGFWVLVQMLGCNTQVMHMVVPYDRVWLLRLTYEYVRAVYGGVMVPVSPQQWMT